MLTTHELVTLTFPFYAFGVAIGMFFGFIAGRTTRPPGPTPSV